MSKEREASPEVPAREKRLFKSSGPGNRFFNEPHKHDAQHNVPDYTEEEVKELRLNELKKNLSLETMESLRNNANKIIIYRFMKKGFNGLTAEDLAATTVNKYFASDFQKISTENWEQTYKEKTAEKLKRCKN